jgi:hypothetical protein
MASLPFDSNTMQSSCRGPHLAHQSFTLRKCMVRKYRVRKSMGRKNETPARRRAGCEFIFGVMPGLVPGIHVLVHIQKTWMAGTSPAMTM